MTYNISIDDSELAKFTELIKKNATPIKEFSWENPLAMFKTLKSELEEKYGESTRVPMLYGWDRWMTVFDGAAVDDLAGRSYTLLELHTAVTDWLYDLSFDTLDEEFHMNYTMIKDIPYDKQELTELYKKLWELRDERPELQETGPYWKEENEDD